MSAPASPSDPAPRPSERARARGLDLLDLCAALFPLPRSLTGEGVRRTLAALAAHAPLRVAEIASGTPVFDWTIPREWNVREAWLADPAGRRVADFARHNLHLLGYSVPMRARMPLADLRAHLYSDPSRPDWIPYRTSYYREHWGFCLAHRELEALADGEYTVHIDTELREGSMSIGEIVLPGESDEVVLVSAHVCHPSLANDNLSGLAVATALAAELAARARRRYTYHFVFAPGTIGAIAWLATHEDVAARVRHGLVLSCLGDRGHVHYKKSRHGGAAVDRAAALVLARRGAAATIAEFSPYGYDERQYCSPGFDLHVGCLMRTPYGEYPEYHSSGDDLSLLDRAALDDSLDTATEIVDLLEADQRYLNRFPKGEPRLGARGLYDSIGGNNEVKQTQLALLWLLNLSDGGASLIDIAERSGIDWRVLDRAAGMLVAAGVLEGPLAPPR